MSPEAKRMKRLEEICEADGEALAKYCEENLNADQIIELAQVKQ